MTLESVLGLFNITFPVRRIPTGQYRLKLIVSTQSAESAVDYDADELGIYEAEPVKIKYSFNDREFFFLLGNLKLKLINLENNLNRMLFIKDVDMLLEFEYKKNGDAEFTPFFSGHIDKENRTNAKYDKVINLSFYPPSEELKVATFIDNTFNNIMPGSYTFNPISWHIVSVKTFVENIYKLIAPDITVEFFQNWTFKSIEEGCPARSFDDLYMYYELAFVNNAGPNWVPNEYTTYADILKVLARSLGCYTGMIDTKKAYFGMFMSFVNDVSEYTAIDGFTGIDDFVEKTPEREIKLVNLTGLREDLHNPVRIGTPTGNEDDELNISVLADMFLVYSLSSYEIVQLAKTPNMEVYQNPEELLINYYGSYYLRSEIAHRDDLRFNKIDYPVTNKLGFDGKVYLWTELELDFGNNKSTAKVLPVGTTMLTPDSSVPVVFDKMLIAQGAQIEINSTRYTGIEQQIFISGQKVYGIFDNMYASEANQQTDYLGNIIDVDEDQRKVYKTTQVYCVYAAEMKPGYTVPEFDYPNAADTQATWYSIAFIQDQKITDPDFEYKILLPRLLLFGKSKYYYWFGMKSSTAELFKRIPAYGAGLHRDEDLS